jgi:hypothetical protein
MMPMSRLVRSHEKPAGVAPSSDDEEGEEPIGPMLLEVKRIARRYDHKQGKYLDGADIEETTKRKGGLDARYAFTVVRQFDEDGQLSNLMSVRSLYFIEAAKTVLAPCRDLTWITMPMSVRRSLPPMPNFTHVSRSSFPHNDWCRSCPGSNSISRLSNPNM